MQISFQLQLFRHFFFMVFIFSVITSGTTFAECVPAYQEQISKQTFFNSKKEYKKMAEVLLQVQAKKDNHPDAIHFEIGGALDKLFAKIIEKHHLFDFKPIQLIHVLARANSSDLLCPKGQKPLKFEDFVDNFPAIYQLVDRNLVQQIKKALGKGVIEDPQFLVDILDHNISEGLQPAAQREVKNYLMKNMEVFFKSPIKLTAQQLINLSQFFDSREGTIKLLERGFEEHIIKTPEDFLTLTQMAFAKKNNPAMRNAYDREPPMAFIEETLPLFFALVPEPSLKQILSLGDITTLDINLDAFTMALNNGLIKTPDQFLDFLHLTFKKGRGEPHAPAMIMAFLNDHFDKLFSLRPLLGKEVLFNLIKDLDKHVGQEASLLAKRLAILNQFSKHTQDYKELLQIGLKATPEDQEVLKNLVYSTFADFSEQIHNREDLNQLQKFLQTLFHDDINLRDMQEVLKERLNDLKKSQGTRIQSKLAKEVLEKLDGNGRRDGICQDQGNVKVQFHLLSQDIDSILDKQKLGKKGLHSCFICMEEKPAGIFTQCPQCHQALCQSCLKDSLQVKLKEKAFPFACDNCHHEILVREIDLADMGLEKEIPTLKRGTIQAYHRALYPKAKDCPTPDCQNRLIPEERDGDGHVDCQFCGKSTCFQCGDFHKGKTCQDHNRDKKGDDGFKALVAAGEIRKCFNPYCQAFLQKNEGCNRVRCLKCNKDNYWDPDSKVLQEWKGYEYHNARKQTWKGVH